MLDMFDGFTRRDAAHPADWPGNGARVGGAIAQESLSGLVTGTLVATTRGWVPVEAIAAGARISTFDHGTQSVIAVTRTVTRIRPVLVPPGALGNDAALTLMPDHSVLVESDAAERLFGDPYAILKARHLAGWRKIHHAEVQPSSRLHERELVTLHFAAPEVLRINGGVRVMADAPLPADLSRDIFSSIRLPAPYASYSGRTARLLVAAMARDDARPGEGDPTSPAA